MTSYRAVVSKYGGEYRLAPEIMAAIDPTLDIPLDTIEPAKDGRCREARATKKLALANNMGVTHFEF